MSYGWRIYFILFFLYRCGMSVAGELVVVRFTTLGDADQYQRSSMFHDFYARDLSFGTIIENGRFFATVATEALGALFSMVLFGNPILIDIGFQAIAFIGIYKFLMVIPNYERRILAVLVLSPSFNLWSSVAGKEALLVFFIGIICAYLTKLYSKQEKLGILEIVSAAGVFIFKVHYVPSLLLIYFSIIIGKNVKQKAALGLLIGLTSILMLYIVKDKVVDLAFRILPHFQGLGSSREVFWVEKYDVFSKAPYGMFQGFFGPTINESLSGPLQMASFLESALIVALLLLILVRRFPELPVYNFIVGFFALGWLLFSCYPLGIMNSGSAIRYRTGHLLLVFFLFAITFSRSYYLAWQTRNLSEPFVPTGGNRENTSGA